MSAGAAAAAVAAQQAKLREEEEELTKYSEKDLSGWEFKIVRSVTKINNERFRQLCEEESKNGWELMEKFDDNRVRFKRLIENRERDATADIDPYRTHFGISEGKFAFVIIGAVFVFIMIVTLIILYYS